MIEGLKIDVPSAELRQHLEERAKYHADKAAWYVAQVETLQGGEIDRGDRHLHNSSDPVRSLKGSARDHRSKAAYFSFIAEHLVDGESYRLSQEDLGQIELASRYYPGRDF